MRRGATTNLLSTLAITALLGLISSAANASGAAAAAIAASSAASSSKHEQLESSIGYSLGNTGYVFVRGHGHFGAGMLFCEPKIGNYLHTPSAKYRNNVIKDGQCLSRRLFGVAEIYKAMPAQQYLDELVGEGKVAVVGIAPAIIEGNLYGVIYYKDQGTIISPVER